MSYKAHRPTYELADLVRMSELKPLIVQPRDTQKDGVPIVHKEICYFHLHDRNMLVRVNAFAFNENRYVDIPKEDTDGRKYIVRYGVCSPCAEARGMVFRKPGDN